MWESTLAVYVFGRLDTRVDVAGGKAGENKTLETTILESARPSMR